MEDGGLESSNTIIHLFVDHLIPNVQRLLMKSIVHGIVSTIRHGTVFSVQSIRVDWPRKHWCSRENFVAIMYTSWDIRNFLSISGVWPPSSISNMPRQGTVIPVYSLYVLPGPGSMGVAVGISLLSCVSAEICATKVSKPPTWIFDFRFLTPSLL